MSDEEEDEEVPAVAFERDERVVYLERRVSLCLRVRADSWSKFVVDEESQRTVSAFLEDPARRVLVFHLLASGAIAASNAVVVPVLSNEQNHASWPAAVAQDVERHVEGLRGHALAARGQAQGRTLLPLPGLAQRSRSARSPSVREMPHKPEPYDRLVVHAVESTVVEWSRQIRAVLASDSAQALRAGAHPGPRAELEFWSARAENLQCIDEQLNTPRVRALSRVLERAESSYCPAFQHICQEVAAGLEEARDVSLHLRPLARHLDALERAELPAAAPLLAPLLRGVTLAWSRSERYGRPERVVVLLQEIANLLIQQAALHLSADGLFTGEVEEGLERVKLAAALLLEFRDEFSRCRDALARPPSPPVTTVGGRPAGPTGPARPWDFPSQLAFARLDLSLQRLRQIQDVFQTALEFSRLERLEFGGVKGRALSEQASGLGQEFLERWKVFQESTYDALDCEDKAFVRDYKDFKRRVLDFDRRLGSILCQAFQDCSGLESAFKLVAIAAGFLERPAVGEIFAANFATLIAMFDQELEASKQIYDQHVALLKKGRGLVNKNMPATAGSLTWAKQLGQRLQKHKRQFRFISHPSMESEEARVAFDKYEEMMALLARHEDDAFAQWERGVDEVCRFSLDRPLLLRLHGDGSLRVNFSSQLSAVLREVKYLQHLELRGAIPAAALAIFHKRGAINQFVSSLELVAEGYNRVQRSLLEVEFPLVAAQLARVDDKLGPALAAVTWQHDDTWAYVRDLCELVGDLDSRLQRSKANVERIQALARSWADAPLHGRRDGRGDPPPLLLAGRSERLAKRHRTVRDDADAIHRLVQQQLGEGEGEEAEGPWLAYLEFIDEILLDGFFSAALRSLHYLREATDASLRPAPLLQVQLELRGGRPRFSPSLEPDDDGDGEGLADVVEQILDDVYGVSSLCPRVATHLGMPHYQQDMEDMLDLAELRQEISARAAAAAARARAQLGAAATTPFAFLWSDDRRQFLRQFLRYGHALPAGEAEAHADDGVPEAPPGLQAFKEQIDVYEQLHARVAALEDARVIDSWLRVDVRPFKTALLNIVCRWSWMFKEHLIHHVTDSLAELEEFIAVTEAGLRRELRADDYEGLVETMMHLMAVRDRQTATDRLFQPLHDTIELLLLYGQRLPDSVHAQLEELPEKWNGLKKMAITVKHEAAPMQSQRVTNIRQKCVKFDSRQQGFREWFRAEAPFAYNSAQPYTTLDKVNREILALEREMAFLQESAALFEVGVPDFKALRLCRREASQLKSVWDLASLVRTSIDDWTGTQWRQINVDHMDSELRRFAKEVRTLDKEVRAWDVYAGLDALVRNTLTSLRAVTELQNPAIRDRHWLQLMGALQVTLEMCDDTTLAELLALQLHRVEEEVKNVVDRAVKEMSIEKVLAEIRQTWTAMEFSYEQHHRTGTPLLKSDEELIETLEENQVALQAILASKHVEFFLEEVSTWQRRLTAADAVVSVWLEAQRTWAHLESIFIGSADIRAQLPADSKRFEGIDADFKELMTESERTRNVIAATNREGLLGKLEMLQQRLALCEKALAEYLETKRLAFPRFYFVSAADLLDILSKGTQPQLVTRHLPKLFDSMADLRLEEADPEQGRDGRTALGMFSGEGEYVAFDGPCHCIGQVETWLGRLEGAMRETIRREIAEAVAAHEDKAREQWLFDFPAQPALAASQVWWATDVGIAFDRLEEGFETALKDYGKKQVAQLNALITMLLGDLSASDRQKIMTICTIDVHARDVVAKLVAQKVTSAQAFPWLSQLRHRWDDAAGHCFANICDAQFLYSYEYLGNTPRLVITPLTDRCYITLTQSLHLTMSGAPAGPAGTGKTETTKDLGRALGIMVYVFNCSEQMDYKSIGNIYKGLAQTGAWGCFDEFNRIAVEVLSVVAVQVKTIQDAIRNKRKRFLFLGEEIDLKPSVGIFITMNPGYAGRTELPENLKALFRPCAMVVPDFELICEIMLVAEGFLDARLLARKFIALYTLCRELLSKQDHYDWGLRAIKSVLVVAGSLRRGDRTRPEDQVLMRALRDFNLPKIVTDDLPVFMGLIGDLFPALDVPRRRNADLEQMVRRSVGELHLQPEENFVLKVVQLEELLAVRHSVFVVGNAGTGKSQILRTLHRTYGNMKLRPVWNDLNPKAVTTDELFGFIHPATREWKDGLFSSIMREQANVSHDGPKWLVLDGDIDPMWIESLNTVMDDNKVLTLASNERVPLKPSMRLLFEISHLRTATPATVSRAGILYVNPQDLGWNPYVASWLDGRRVQSERANLTILFEKYVPPCLEQLRSNFKPITPQPECSIIQTLCSLLDCLLTPLNSPADSPRELYELYFVFACIWAFGGALFHDQLIDYRAEFSRWWLKEMKTVKLPSQGTVFDYFIDPASRRFLPWSERVGSFDRDPERPLQSVVVPTAETARLRYLLGLLASRGKPVLLVGNAGVGKTALVAEHLGALPDDYAVTSVPLNYYTTSAMLQRVLERPLEKKAGRNYGPPGNKRMVYFLDDVNMPEVDAYGTVQPHTLIRQHLDYGHWYDRQKLGLKEIHGCQYVACMNPTAGSFTINPRLQRHFTVLAVNFPGAETLEGIYSRILAAHLQQGGFAPAVVRAGASLVQAAVALHQRVAQNFLPTAVKFHYVFNLRDLSSVFQGLLFAGGEAVRSPTELARLWLHESARVYGDKLVGERDADSFGRLLLDTARKHFEGVEDDALAQQPLLFCHFAGGVGDARYAPVPGWESLRRTLAEALSAHNELNPAMNLVLFNEAMQHVCRISRILEGPRGNALLVGVGGSGKQSLARLAAFIGGLDVFQVTLRKGYSVQDLRGDIAGLYLKAGVKNQGTVFLLTDAHVPDERFLVLLNDMLASGEIPDLLSEEEVEGVVSAVRAEVRGLGLLDTREACWRFFLERVRRQLKVVLCFSPVGSTLRVRARRFPALVNCTAIDWFHEWPRSALESVSRSFIEDIEGIAPEVKDSISLFMAFAHASVNAVGERYRRNEKRHNYTTPKSFLEQIKLYQGLLGSKRRELALRMERLDSGLHKLQSTAAQVDELKERLASQEVELLQRNDDAEALIAKIGLQTARVGQEKAVADAEEQKVAGIQEQVAAQQRECEEDLVKAEPALVAATSALNTLNRLNLTELKTFPNPPVAVTNVTAAVMALLAPGGRVPRDRSWKSAKVFMGRVDDFLQSLVNYNKEHIPEACLRVVKDEYISKAEFNPELVRTKSFAAAGLCAWVINIVKYYEVYCDVEPKRRALAQANTDLASATDKLEAIRKKLAELDANLAKLTAAFETATGEKLRCQEEVSRTNHTIHLANRLVTGLQSEKVRWAQSVAEFRAQEQTLCGDVLLTAAFVSYLGYFTKRYRQELLDGMWGPFLRAQKVPIPMSEGLDPVSVLTDGATVASWQNEGLPRDRMSTENAALLAACQRWPLLVDPQLQAARWVRGHFGARLRVVRLGQKGYLDVIERAMAAGETVLIENLEETVDPVLDPLLGRNSIKKGKFIKIGDKECEYHPDFRLVLHTKLANPHYRPELQAQTTLVNFTVTRDGLEEQLLGRVVSRERPDLEGEKSELTTQQNSFKIELKQLEDELLTRLSAAHGSFLGDTQLVEKLEETKRTAADIEAKVLEAKVNELRINEARELYRAVAVRSSLLFFIINDLNSINPIYQFSLKAFTAVFHKAMDRAVASDDVHERVLHLTDCITHSVFVYTSRGLFERDKLTFAAQTAFQILLVNKEIEAGELDFLLRFNIEQSYSSPVEFLSEQAWSAIKAMSLTDDFRGLDRDIEGSAKRWKKFVESEAPEKERLPQDWKNKTPLQKLIMIRALRPDRMTYAIRNFVEEKLGAKYVEARAADFAASYEESGPGTPLLFVLSPGVDPLKDVESLGKKLGFTIDSGKLHNISLGQGQEAVAEEALERAAREGHWVILQNVHLVSRWLGTLEKLLERLGDEDGGSSPELRVFISAEPAASPSEHVIPQGILESSVKITNEPPSGMMANLHAALLNFDQDTLETCTREHEFKSLLFSLCYFHACVAERRKFGPQGWNRSYPFNTGDLTISCNVLYNYLEANAKVPWEDLRYLFGEIMYGGHITDDWDRRLCRAYLQELVHPEQLDGEFSLAPGFLAPPNLDYPGYHRYVDECLPPESPALYGLHPNAEIEFLTLTSSALFRTLLELQPRDNAGGEGAAGTAEEKVKGVLDDIVERLPEEFHMAEVMGKTAERSPFVLVCFQECERMNLLLGEVRRSLHELDLGLKGELTISAEMERLQNALFYDLVPDSWTKLAYPSTYGLARWFTDLLLRCRELDTWTHDLALPAVVWLSGFFNPQSFLTAIMQVAARRNEWPLDRMTLAVDVTKKGKDDVGHAPREGAYVHGLFMEGARWDGQAGLVAEARLKELTPAMPVMFVRAVPAERQQEAARGLYECPVYRTKARGPTYVWTFGLRTKQRPAKWVLAGVALLLNV
ncbi:dynein axonemal heavy chain 11 [Lampetra fluviatilis]